MGNDLSAEVACYNWGRGYPSRGISSPLFYRGSLPFIDKEGFLLHYISDVGQTVHLYSHGVFLWSLEEHIPVAALMIFLHGEVGGMSVYKFHDWSMGEEDPRYKFKLIEFYFNQVYPRRVALEVDKIKKFAYDLVKEYSYCAISHGFDNSSLIESTRPSDNDLGDDDMDAYDAFVSGSSKDTDKSDL
ncbi:hypothetical protein ACLB2K_031070 [Fragaria x ananassa]